MVKLEAFRQRKSAFSLGGGNPISEAASKLCGVVINPTCTVGCGKCGLESDTSSEARHVANN
jgi:hypothetical protein